MRVGKEFQATVSPLQVTPADICTSPERAVCLWVPASHLTDLQIDNFVAAAIEKYKYTCEMALGMLFWHRHNLENASADLPNFTPKPDDWSLTDQVRFEQAYSFHGKAFNKIREMMPEKSVPQLVKYYYKWKKTRTQSGMLERQNDANDSSSEPDTAANRGGEAFLAGGWRRGRHAARRRPRRSELHAGCPEVDPISQDTAGVLVTTRRRRVPRDFHLDLAELLQLADMSELEQAECLDKVPSI